MADNSFLKKDHAHQDSDAFEAELRQLDPSKFPLLVKYGEAELYRMRGGVGDMIDLISAVKTKIRVKVDLPSETDTQVNYVGKLLGPRGTIFRAIQENTHTRMAILGQGSMRNEQKEQELLSSGEQKFQHLKQKLHMQIDSYASPVDAYYNIWCALCECRKILNEPDMGPPGQQQMPPMGGFQGPMRGGRGGMMSPGGYGRGGGAGPPQMQPPQPHSQMPPMNGQQNQPPMAPDMYGMGVPPPPNMNFGGDYAQTQDWGGKMNNSPQDNRGGRGGNRGARGRGVAHPYFRRGGANPQ